MKDWTIYDHIIAWVLAGIALAAVLTAYQVWLQ